jgi:DNA-binding MarR family transcriptional regulator
MIATAIIMPAPAVPEDLQDLLRQHVESIDQLEVLALLREQEPRAWIAEDVARRLNLPVSAARAALQQLSGRGLLAVSALEEAEFSYRPLGGELRERTERLLQLYATERAAVMRVLSSNAIARLRAGALSAFGSGKKDGG